MAAPRGLAIRASRYVVAVAGLWALAGCGGQTKLEEAEDRIRVLQSNLSQAQSKLSDYESAVSDMRSKVDALDTAASSLDDEVDRLNDENWQYVVPRLRDARDGVVSAKDEAVSSVEELEALP